ncbi:MAG: hypothetical protein OXE17_09945 [Chloroflexi bacterium]|nr:hypothetical protein [Chloroflexota bacterium]
MESGFNDNVFTDQCRSELFQVPIVRFVPDGYILGAKQQQVGV